MEKDRSPKRRRGGENGRDEKVESIGTGKRRICI